jgi:hypothetical protein
MSTTEQQITQPKAPPALTEEKVRDMFQEFTRNRNLTPEAGGAQLMADNAELRADKRRLKDKIDALEANQIPAGAKVLTGEAIKEHDALKALLTGDQKPEDLVKLLKEHGELTTKVSNLEKQNIAVQIAEAEGWKVSALLKLAKDMDLVLENVEEDIDDEENEGKKKRVSVPHGFVQTKDAAGAITKKRLSDELKDFLPSLAREPGDGKDSDGEQHEESGTKFVRQSRGDKAPAKSTNVSQSFLAGRYGSTFPKGDDKK